MAFRRKPPEDDEDVEGGIEISFEGDDEVAPAATIVADTSTVIDIDPDTINVEEVVVAEVMRTATAARSTSSLRVEDPYWAPAYRETCNIFGHDFAWYRTSTIIEVIEFFLMHEPTLLDLLNVSSPKACDALLLRRYIDDAGYNSAALVVKLSLRDLVYAIAIAPNPDKAEETVRRILRTLYGR